MINISFFLRYPVLSIAALLIVFFTACGDEDQSRFGSLLNRPPFDSLTDSIRAQPENDDLYFKRAVLLNRNNLPEPALADFQKAWSLSKQEKYAYGITNVWIDKKPDSAVAFLQEALQQLPESYLLRISLARAYEKQEKIDDALKVCDEVLRAVPGSHNIWLLKSQLLDKKGDAKNSIAALEKAYMLMPSNIETASGLAYKYAENNDPKTLALCDSLIRIDSLGQFAQPYYIKGIYYSNIKDKPKALRFFNETIRRDYNFLNAYIEKGKILVDQKKIKEALTVFQLANTIKPAFADAYYWMGVCQEAMGLKEDARLNYEKAYSLDKTFTEAKEAAQKIPE